MLSQRPTASSSPPARGFWPGRRLSRDHRDAATRAGLRSVRAVPPQGPRARCPGKWQNTLPRAPQTWLPHLLPSTTGTWCWTRFQQPSEPPALPCSWHSNVLHPAAGNTARPAAPNLPQTCPKPRNPDEYPCGNTLPGTETSPTHHTSHVVQQSCYPTGSRIRKKLSSRHHTMAMVGGHAAPMSTNSITKPLQGHCASHPRGELWHPTDLLLWPQGCFRVTLHSATCMPAQCPCSTLPVGSQFQAGTSIHVLLGPTSLSPNISQHPCHRKPSTMPWSPSLTTRPQHPCHGVPIPQSDPSVHTPGTPAIQLDSNSPYHRDFIPVAGSNSHTIVTRTPVPTPC